MMSARRISLILLAEKIMVIRMSTISDRDSIEAFQLKECYELAAQFEKLDMAKEVLREKSKRIELPNNYIPVHEDAAYQETEMQIVSEVIYGLSLEGFTASEYTESKYAYKINNLPSSAEKEYVLALLALRKGTNETQRLDAIRHISVALSFSPDDPRYIALASVLEDADK